LEKVERGLKRIGRSGLLPAGLILTGGGAKLAGLAEFAKHKLKLPVSLGYPLNITSVTDKVNDLSFTTAIGLVKWGALALQAGAGQRTTLFVQKHLFDRFKKIFKMLVP
jgi:cell division protein FtsA